MECTKRNIPDTVLIISHVLQAPLCVMHSTAAFKIDKIEVSWSQNLRREDSHGNPILDKNGNVIFQDVQRTFRLIRSAIDPLPTSEHAKYLDTLLTMFASQTESYRDGRKLYFKYRDVLTLSGKKPTSSIKAIKETIYRYMRSTFESSNYFPDGENLDAKEEATAYHIIKKCSMFDGRGNEVKNHIGRSKNSSGWNWIEFDEEIINALKKHKSGKRIFLTDVLKKLDSSAFIVYRHYWGFGDKKQHWRNLEFLSNIFKSASNRGTFIKPWLIKQFDKLESFGLIEKPEWNGNAVGIKCKTLEEIKENEFLNCLKNNLSESSYSIYDILYKNGLKNNLPIKVISDSIIYNKSNFSDFLKDQLDLLESKKLITQWAISSNKLSYCRPPLDKNLILKINSNFQYLFASLDESRMESSEKGASFDPELDSKSVGVKILEKYFEIRSKRKIDDSISKNIDTLLELGKNDLAVSAIQNKILQPTIDI